MGSFVFRWPWLIVGFFVFFDQFLKILIKTSLDIGEEIKVFDWFFIYFIENNGFAFGYEFFGSVGKFLLTLIRVVFVVFIYRWLVFLIKTNTSSLLVFGVLLIFSGAIGNIIDSVFYGVFFDYAPLFFGRVVDMFYFPFFSGFYPDWVPFFGGEKFVFFRFVFNIADSCITVGAVILLFFYKNLTFN